MGIKGITDITPGVIMDIKIIKDSFYTNRHHGYHSHQRFL
jgi:hypothetical protein